MKYFIPVVNDEVWTCLPHILLKAQSGLFHLGVRLYSQSEFLPPSHMRQNQPILLVIKTKIQCLMVASIDEICSAFFGCPQDLEIGRGQPIRYSRSSGKALFSDI